MYLPVFQFQYLALLYSKPILKRFVVLHHCDVEMTRYHVHASNHQRILQGRGRGF